MRNQSLFYQESGKYNAVKNTVAYAVGIPLVLVLAYFYAFFVGIIPIIYLNVLLTIGFGVVLGFITVIFNKLSHNRNKKSRIIFAAIISLIASYGQFTAFIIRLYLGSETSLLNYALNLDWFIHPSDFIELISEVNKVGAWSIFGVMFTGIQLTVVWIIEILILIIIPVALVFRKETKPYSEFNGKWYPKYVLFNDFESIAAVSVLLKDLKESPVQAIKNLEKGHAMRSSKIYLFFMKEEEKQYITFENHYVDTDNKNQTDIVINNFMINRASADAIMKEFETKQEKFDLL